MLQRLAAVHEEKLKDVAGAASVHERILERVPGDRASIDALIRLHEGAGDWTKVADSLERLLGVVEGQEAIDTAHRLAKLAAEQLEDPARTEAALQKAFELDPASTDTRDKLKAHYEEHDEPAKLAMMLDAEAEQVDDTGAKVELFKRIAELHQQQLGDAGTAASYLERASELVPDDRGVLTPLCDLYIEAGRSQDAIPVLEKIVESFGNRRSKELAQYQHRLGRALEGLGESEKALEHYDAAFKVDLTNVPILRDLGRLCHARGDYDRAQKTFRALLLQKLDGGAGITKADVYYYLGDISAKQGDKNKAVSMLERAVAEQKDHPDATALLAELKG
ncbi:MAG: tetratricopeptide repeat protein [Polyangiales bacterium]